MFGKKLKQLRNNRGMTQQQLADELNIKRGTIAAYETKNMKPSFVQLLKISNFFKVPVDYFYDSDVDHTDVVNVLELSDDDFIKNVQLFYGGKKLSDNETIELLNYARYLSSKNDNK